MPLVESIARHAGKIVVVGHHFGVVISIHAARDISGFELVHDRHRARPIARPLISRIQEREESPSSERESPASEIGSGIDAGEIVDRSEERGSNERIHASEQRLVARVADEVCEEERESVLRLVDRVIGDVVRSHGASRHRDERVEFILGERVCDVRVAVYRACVVLVGRDGARPVAQHADHGERERSVQSRARDLRIALRIGDVKQIIEEDVEKIRRPVGFTATTGKAWYRHATLRTRFLVRSAQEDDRCSLEPDSSAAVDERVPFEAVEKVNAHLDDVALAVGDGVVVESGAVEVQEADGKVVEVLDRAIAHIKVVEAQHVDDAGAPSAASLERTVVESHQPSSLDRRDEPTVVRVRENRKVRIARMHEIDPDEGDVRDIARHSKVFAYDHRSVERGKHKVAARFAKHELEAG